MEPLQAVEVVEEQSGFHLNATEVAQDVTTLVIGSLLGAIFGFLVVFVIPRLTAVADFGYWRIFVLYAGYVGFLHMGFGEGALLSWAGEALEEFRPELSPSLKFMIGQHLLILL